MNAIAPLFDLSGRVAVVTGGNGGIGRSIAIGLARAGASIAVLARNEQKNRTVLAELQAVGARAIALQLDVTARDALAPSMAQVEQELGPIDILVNNAGIVMPSGGVLRESVETWDSTLATCRKIHGCSQARKGHQLGEHVLNLWRCPHTLLQRRQGRCCATDKVHGD
jgi:2-deoxy-D-gluconate 3-dehydrogenase